MQCIESPVNIPQTPQVSGYLLHWVVKIHNQWGTPYMSLRRDFIGNFSKNKAQGDWQRTSFEWSGIPVKYVNLKLL